MTSSDPLWAEVHGGKDTAGQLFAIDTVGRAYVLNTQVAIPNPNGGEALAPAERRWALFDNGRYDTMFTDKKSQVWSITNRNLSMAR